MPKLANSVPLVSIGMPVSNGEDFIADAIESILAQDFSDFELIISDNASTDSTPDICRSYAQKDDRIKFIRHPKNIGAAKNYNHVFFCSSGRYFKWAAHDDLLGNKFISDCLDGFRERGDLPVLVYPNFQFVDVDCTPLPIESPFVHTTAASPAIRLKEAHAGLGLVTSVFGLFRRDALAKTRLIGSYDSADFVLLLECAVLGQIVRLKGDPQFQRRLHDNSSRANKTDDEIRIWFDPDGTENPKPKRRLQKEYYRSIFWAEGLSNWQRIAISTALFKTLTNKKLRGISRRAKQRLAPRFSLKMRTGGVRRPVSSGPMMPREIHNIDIDKK